MNPCRTHVSPGHIKAIASQKPRKSALRALRSRHTRRIRFFSHRQQPPHAVGPLLSMQLARAPASSPPPLRTRQPPCTRRSRRKRRRREKKRARKDANSEGGGLTRTWAVSGCRRWAHAPLPAARVTRSCPRPPQAPLAPQAAGGTSAPSRRHARNYPSTTRGPPATPSTRRRASTHCCTPPRRCR